MKRGWFQGRNMENGRHLADIYDRLHAQWIGSGGASGTRKEYRCHLHFKPNSACMRVGED
jgi:hypothetical protein